MIDACPPAPSTLLADRSRPQDGDIVVREERRGQFFVYLLRAEPGPDQVIVGSRDTALEQATSLARRRRVRAWLTVDGHAPNPLHHPAQARRPGGQRNP